jgi:hypothetical protein
MQPRIPSFLCSELDGEIHLIPLHPSNRKLEILVIHLKDGSSKMTTSPAKREVTIPTGASKVSSQFTKLRILMKPGPKNRLRAFNKVVKSVQAAGNGPSYTKYEIHTLTANGQTGPCVARWQAGA